jgi:hypothetical protein
LFPGSYFQASGIFFGEVSQLPTEEQLKSVQVDDPGPEETAVLQAPKTASSGLNWIFLISGF